MSDLAIAVCCDKGMKIGLHVTLHSMLTHLSADRTVQIFLLYQGFNEKDISRLRETLDLTKKKYVLQVWPVQIQSFQRYRSLLGNYMTYVRLLLAEELPALDKVLYLDSDLIVQCDVSKLYDVDTENFCIGAIPGGPFRYALEHDFYCTQGFDMDVYCFNAGVLLFNLKQWREQKMLDTCIQFLEKNSEHCLSADQVVLNSIFYNQYCSLPNQFNILLSPMEKQDGIYPNGILHLVGSPKPWDAFGEITNSHSPLFYKILDKTAYRNWRSWKTLSSFQPARLRGILRIAKKWFTNKITLRKT